MTSSRDDTPRIIRGSAKHVGVATYCSCLVGFFLPGDVVERGFECCFHHLLLFSLNRMFAFSDAAKKLVDPRFSHLPVLLMISRVFFILF